MQLFILLCIYFLYLPYMFRAPISPSSGVSQPVFYVYNHLVPVLDKRKQYYRNSNNLNELKALELDKR